MSSSNTLIVNNDFSIDVPRGIIYDLHPSGQAIVLEKLGSFSMNLSFKNMLADGQALDELDVRYLLEGSCNMLAEELKSETGEIITPITKLVQNGSAIKAGYSFMTIGNNVFYYLLVMTQHAMYGGHMMLPHALSAEEKSIVDYIFESIKPAGDGNSPMNHSATQASDQTMDGIKNLIEMFGGVVVDAPNSAQPSFYPSNGSTAVNTRQEAKKNSVIETRNAAINEAHREVDAHRNKLLSELPGYLDLREKEAHAQIVEIQKQLSTEINAEKEKRNTEISHLEDSINSDKSTLAQLGFLQFSKKKELNARIETNTAELNRLKESLSVIDNSIISALQSSLIQKQSEKDRFAHGKAQYEEKIIAACDQFRQRIEDYYKYMHQADNERIILLSNDPLYAQRPSLESRVFDILACDYGGGMTISDMQKQDCELSEYSLSFMSSIVHGMVRKGDLQKRMAGGKTLFELSDGSSYSHGSVEAPSVEVIIDDIGWDIRSKPQPPTLDAIIHDQAYPPHTTIIDLNELIRTKTLEFLRKNAGKGFTGTDILKSADGINNFSLTKFITAIQPLLESNQIKKQVAYGRTLFSV